MAPGRREPPPMFGTRRLLCKGAVRGEPAKRGRSDGGPGEFADLAACRGVNLAVLLAPLRPGAAHVMELRPVRIEQAFEHPSQLGDGFAPARGGARTRSEVGRRSGREREGISLV